MLTKVIVTMRALKIRKHWQRSTLRRGLWEGTPAPAAFRTFCSNCFLGVRARRRVRVACRWHNNIWREVKSRCAEWGSWIHCPDMKISVNKHVRKKPLRNKYHTINMFSKKIIKIPTTSRNRPSPVVRDDLLWLEIYWLVQQNLQSRCPAWRNGGTWQSPTTASSGNCVTCRMRYSGRKSDLGIEESVATKVIMWARRESNSGLSAVFATAQCQEKLTISDHSTLHLGF